MMYAEEEASEEESGNSNYSFSNVMNKFKHAFLPNKKKPAEDK